MFGFLSNDSDAIPERTWLPSSGFGFYRHKTKVPVFVPIPAAVAEMMHDLPNSNPRYFFWSGNGDPHTAKKDGNDPCAASSKQLISKITPSFPFSVRIGGINDLRELRRSEIISRNG